MNEVHIPRIQVTRHWSKSDVRNACIRNNLYTRGDCCHYEQMLNFVDDNEPTTENLYRVALDICNHSVAQDIANVMFIIEREAVFTCFDVEPFNPFADYMES